MASRLAGGLLTDANLTHTKLVGASLVGADLRRADLTGVKLTGADLREADLTGANLTDANLTNVHGFNVNIAGVYRLDSADNTVWITETELVNMGVVRPSSPHADDSAAE